MTNPQLDYRCGCYTPRDIYIDNNLRFPIVDESRWEILDFRLANAGDLFWSWCDNRTPIFPDSPRVHKAEGPHVTPRFIVKRKENQMEKLLKDFVFEYEKEEKELKSPEVSYGIEYRPPKKGDLYFDDPETVVRAGYDLYISPCHVIVPLAYPHRYEVTKKTKAQVSAQQVYNLEDKKVSDLLVDFSKWEIVDFRPPKQSDEAFVGYFSLGATLTKNTTMTSSNPMQARLILKSKPAPAKPQFTDTELLEALLKDLHGVTREEIAKKLTK